MSINIQSNRAIINLLRLGNDREINTRLDKESFIKNDEEIDIFHIHTTTAEAASFAYIYSSPFTSCVRAHFTSCARDVNIQMKINK